MRDFSETPGATVSTDVPEPDFPPTNWLSASQAIGKTLYALSCNIGKNSYKPGHSKAFLHCTDLEDPNATERTISFTDQSVAFRQLEPIIARHLLVEQYGGESPYPFTFTVVSVGKTYGIAPIAAARNQAPAQAEPYFGGDDIPF